MVIAYGMTTEKTSKPSLAQLIIKNAAIQQEIQAKVELKITD